jgi:hypothetical protein
MRQLETDDCRCPRFSSVQASQERHDWQRQGTSRCRYITRRTMSDAIQKIRERQLAAPTLSETLQDLVINELKEKKHTATEGLLWLTR